MMLPATKNSYDFWIPATMTLHDAVPSISQTLESREKDRFSASSESVLMAHESGDILDHDQAVEALGLVNGVRLVLL